MHLYRFENFTHRRRTAAGAVATLAACCGLALTGCGPKEAEETPAPPAPGSTAAAGAPTTGSTPADQGKIATGADPDKAPPYPGMYGKPAGAR